MQQDRQAQQLQNHDVKNEANKDNLVDQSRRKTLKKIAAGGAVAGILALSGKWSKPVVDSIILPAHAQATGQR
ncbi:MAG TPA: twin-arginine translocation signal domain-containing protein [Desulfobulbaceae bacterium]|nr:twin-arginine translocation signal domain-containing protein [Desulfobulbaceae bacterium]